MESELVIGGYQPFGRRLTGVSILTIMGSIYNMSVWDKVAAAWVKAGVGRTLEGEAVARLRYQETGLNLENGVCVGDPHIVVERCLVFLCILHCCMAMGRLQVAFIEARLGDLPKDNATACNAYHTWHARVSDRVPRLHLTERRHGHGSSHGRKSGHYWPMPQRMESGKPWLPCGTSLWDLYSDTPPRTDLWAAEVARAYRLHCGKAACQSNYHFCLEEDMTLAVAIAAALGVGLGAVCANVVESLNSSLKRAYNDHTARQGGTPAATALQRKWEVVLQASEWWFLKFDLPLRHHGAPYTA